MGNNRAYLTFPGVSLRCPKDSEWIRESFETIVHVLCEYKL